MGEPGRGSNSPKKGDTRIVNGWLQQYDGAKWVNVRKVGAPPPSSPSGTNATPKSSSNNKSSGIDFADAAEIYRRLGIAVNKAFINKWKGKVNSLYEFRDMLRWNDPTYRKSQEYRSQMVKMKLAMGSFFPGREGKFKGIMDTAVRRGWDTTDLFTKLVSTKFGKKYYAGYKQFTKQEPGMAMNPLKAAMEYRNLATAQRNIYKSLGLPEPTISQRRTYFSNKASYDQAAQLASAEALRAMGSATRFAYGPQTMAGTKENALYDRIRRALEIQKSYLSSNRSQFQMQRDESGEVISPYL